MILQKNSESCAIQLAPVTLISIPDGGYNLGFESNSITNYYLYTNWEAREVKAEIIQWD